MSVTLRKLRSVSIDEQVLKFQLGEVVESSTQVPTVLPGSIICQKRVAIAIAKRSWPQ